MLLLPCRYLHCCLVGVWQGSTTATVWRRATAREAPLRHLLALSYGVEDIVDRAACKRAELTLSRHTFPFVLSFLLFSVML